MHSFCILQLVELAAEHIFHTRKKERKKMERNTDLFFIVTTFFLFHSLYLHISKTGDGGNSVVADALWKVSQKELVSKKKHKVQKK